MSHNLFAYAQFYFYPSPYPVLSPPHPAPSWPTTPTSLVNTYNPPMSSSSNNRSTNNNNNRNTNNNSNNRYANNNYNDYNNNNYDGYNNYNNNNNNRNSNFGIINNVPFDVNDSFTNYDWEPPETNNNNNGNGNDGNLTPSFTYRNNPLAPIISYNGMNSGPYNNENNSIRIPLRPYDYHAVYMDDNEDMFDGVPQNRWSRAPSSSQPHNFLSSNQPLPLPLVDVHAERSNVPIGRQLGFHRIPSYLHTEENIEAWGPRRGTSSDGSNNNNSSNNNSDRGGNSNRNNNHNRINNNYYDDYDDDDDYYYNNNSSERYIDVSFSDIIRPRNVFTPPHFPGLQ